MCIISPSASDTGSHRPHDRAVLRAVLSAASFVAALALTNPATAAPAATVTFAQGSGERAEFSFDRDKGSAGALVIHTTRVGVGGSRLALKIDRSPRYLFDRVLRDNECKFGEAGSECTITIAGDDPLYAAVVTAFRLGRNAHLTIEDAGTMKMSATSSLKGFVAAYGG